MQQMKYTWWKDSDYYIGHLNEYPDYETEGKTLEELQANLKDLYADITSEKIPYIHHVAELVLA